MNMNMMLSTCSPVGASASFQPASQPACAFSQSASSILARRCASSVQFSSVQLSVIGYRLLVIGYQLSVRMLLSACHSIWTPCFLTRKVPLPVRCRGAVARLAALLCVRGDGALSVCCRCVPAGDPSAVEASEGGPNGPVSGSVVRPSPLRSLAIRQCSAAVLCGPFVSVCTARRVS